MRRLVAASFGTLALLAPVSVRAQQAATGAQTGKAYGARVGARNERPEAPGVSLDVRTVKRLPTRIGSRVTTRVERYADPNRGLWAYSVVPDDGVRRSAAITAPPSRPERPPIDDQGDRADK